MIISAQHTYVPKKYTMQQAGSAQIFIFCGKYLEAQEDICFQIMY